MTGSRGGPEEQCKKGTKMAAKVARPDLRQDGSRTIAINAAPDGEVSDKMKRIPSGEDIRDEWQSCQKKRRVEELRSQWMHDSGHEQDAGKRETQGQEEQCGEETTHETGASEVTRVRQLWRVRRTQ